MKKNARLRKPRLSPRDWIGDAVLVILCGVALVAAVFLPWANADIPGRVNYSLHRSAGISGVLATEWGTPALVIALTVLAAGVAMLLFAPRRGSWLFGVLVAALGLAALGVAQDAYGAMMWFDPGAGLYLTMLVGVLLAPIGLAAALVAWILVRAQRAGAGPVTPDGPPPAPPSPGNDPPS